MIDSGHWRRTLARELTVRSRMTPLEAMRHDVSYGCTARRVGITGAPGVGKSSLIAQLIQSWVPARIGVLAIDPTSPISGGALLGDRIRMDAVAQASEAVIRSLGSGNSADGLCPNIVLLLDAMEKVGIERVVLETVGVGQVSYEVRSLVDTCVLVLIPESGDTIQAMKAGILEMADIYVVNKADLPGAPKLIGELQSIAQWRSEKTGWTPPVISASTKSKDGIAELGAAIDAHVARTRTTEAVLQKNSERRTYHLRSVLERLFHAIVAEQKDIAEATSTSVQFKQALERICALRLPD